MPDLVKIKVLTPADDYALITLEDAKILLGVPTGDTSGDAQLEMLIDQTSYALGTRCNRVFAREKVEETWQCVGPICCPDGSARIWLTHFPVKDEDIEVVESPKGTVLDPASYLLNEYCGELTVYGGAWVDEIFVRYTGGYDLPEEAPLDLQQLTTILVRTQRSQAAQETTVGAGVRLIAHKESRVMYFSPKDMAAGGGSTGTTATPAQSALDTILSKYTRYSI